MKELLDNFKWSYSRVNSYKICPRMFYITYILKKKTGSGPFDQYGTFMHEIMEMYNKGELGIYDLVEYYKENYSYNIVSNFPPNKYVNLNDTYFNAGLDYLENFNGYDDKLLQAEEKFDFDLEYNGKKIRFTGLADRISMDENGIILSDYKSKKKFKNKKEEYEYFRQLYAYCIPIYNKYKQFPYKLKFHFFRDKDRKCEKNFNKEEFEDAKSWMFNVISEIYEEKEFKQNYNEFFCKYICSVSPEDCSCKLHGKDGGNY